MIEFEFDSTPETDAMLKQICVKECFVRCKDCIHWNKKLKREIYGEIQHACQKLRGRFERSIPYTYADDFCSRGERR